jgi:zinc/manganese transport system substrate-binding protein
MRSAAPFHRRPQRRRISAVALATVTALVLAACSSGDDAAPATTSDPVTVVVTTAILGDVVQNLVGSDGTVQVLMASGVDPHGYQASAADAAAMRSADLVIANGLLLEDGLISALEAAEEDGVRVFTVADKVDPIEFAEGGHAHDHGDEHAHDDDHDHGDEHAHDDDHDHEHAHDDDHGDEHAHDDEHDHAHDHGDEDPHFWWDPMRMTMAVDLIATELVALRPDVDWAARASVYNEQVLAAHEQMVALFATIPAENRRIITNHDALGYLEDRYGFEVIGTVIPGSSTTVETNARAFAELIELMVAEGVSVVFADNTASTVLAEQLATQTAASGGVDVTVVQILTDSLGEPGSGADTYLTMLILTAELITEALRAA